MAPWVEHEGEDSGSQSLGAIVEKLLILILTWGARNFLCRTHAMVIEWN